MTEYLNNDYEKIDKKPEITNLLHPESFGIGNDDYIVFKDVYLSYSESNVQDKKYALSGVSLTIKKGEKVAICGRYCYYCILITLKELDQEKRQFLMHYSDCIVLRKDTFL